MVQNFEHNKEMLESCLFNVIRLLNIQLVKTQNFKITNQKKQEDLLNSLELEKIKRGKKLKGENEQVFVNNQNNVIFYLLIKCRETVIIL